MNVSYVTSVMVAGMLILALLAWNMRVSENSGNLALSQITKQRVDGIGSVINMDLRNLGQGVSINPIVMADSVSITFRMVAPNQSIQTVSWRFWPDETIPETVNPNDRRLTRTVNATTTTMSFGVTQFRLTYFDSNGQVTNSINDIRRIRVEITVESDEPYNNVYALAYWESDITPRAIQ